MQACDNKNGIFKGVVGSFFHSDGIIIHHCMKPFFSIVIPTLNEDQYLPKLLSDLTNQNQNNFEVVIVDGYSDDTTKQKAQHFKKKLRMRFYNVKKRDVSLQRNIGAKKAKGEFLIFLDADARVGSTFIKTLHSTIQKSNYLIYIPQLVPRPALKTSVVLFKLVNVYIKYSQRTNKPIAPGGSLIIHKKIFTRLRGYKESKLHEEHILYPEDQDILVRAKRRNIVTKYLDKVSVGFSLRRMEKEGWLSVALRYTISIYEMMTSGKTSRKLQYEMGGQVYKDN